jgi:beta-lactamase class A
MRLRALALALALAVAPMAVGTPAVAAPTLSGRLDVLVGAFPGGTALWVADPAAAQPLYATNADERVIAASLWKLAVLAEAEHQVDLGRLRYDGTIVIEPEDVTEDGSFEAPGTELTVDDALERMITISDNGTAMAFWRILGAGNINALLSTSGIAGFRVATDPSEDNIVTARAVGTYFTKLAKGQLVSKAASARMLQRLERQQVNDRIPAQLPEGTRVAHKTGNLVGLVHDAGIVFTPRAQRVVVAMTWDTDDDPATELIAHVASAVYSEAITPPASARYSVPLETQYVQHGATLALDVDVENIGDDPWTASGPGRMSLVWELRDPSNKVVARAPKALPLGQVPPGGSVRVPVVIGVPTRPGDAKLVVGLQDASGRALSSLGVASASIPVRIHLPFLVATTVRIPSVMHRREASMVEVSYTAFEPIRWDDHHLFLGWRFVDPSTDRVVAQGAVPLGVMRTYERAGTFFAPLVAPNVRGTYVLEYELRERGFVAGAPRSKIVEVGAPRTFAQ